MKIMTRYVLSELLQTFLVTLLGMTLFMIIVGVIREAYSQGLGMKQIVLLLPYVLPEALRFSIPGTVLLTACTVYGRMASNNEVIALKAAGISPWAIFWPIISLGIALSLLTVWLSDVTVTWGRSGIRRVVIESVEEIAYSKLTQQRAFSTKGFSINVQRVDGKRLINPTLTFQSNLDSPAYTITAAEAELRADPSANTLAIICRDSEYEMGTTKGRIPGEIQRVVSLSESTRKGASSGSPAELPMSEIETAHEQCVNQVKYERTRMAALAGLMLVQGELSSLSEAAWQPLQANLKEIQYRILRLEMEPHRRWSTGFSCLCFVCVGSPLSILMRKADILTSFFVCFMPVLLLYYPLLITSIDQAKSGRIPGETVWLGNVIMLGVGWLLYKKVRRY
jgi:lipopolysaccharide export system permease protein